MFEMIVFYFLRSWKYWKLKSPTFSIILKILEIEVSNILYNPGNIGNRVFLIAWYPGNTGGGRAEAGGRLQGLCCAALDYFWNMFPGISGYPGNIGNLFFLYFGIFTKKTRAEISRRMHRRMSRDLSYETDSGPKTKTVSGAIALDIYSLGWQ